jgi:16S rRNA (guanine527-N7)-methyltransferase
MTVANPGSESLNDLLAEAGIETLDDSQIAKFDMYLGLILKWNAKFNLTAIRDREGILRRHFVECVACADFLPPGVKTVLDFGSGAGFPGIPIAICRPEIKVTLAESQTKKAGFLHEAVRLLGVNANVFVGRAESIGADFDCVTLRAVDQMNNAVAAALPLVAPGGALVAMTSEGCLAETMEKVGESVRWDTPRKIAGSSQGVLLLGFRDTVPRGTLLPNVPRGT